MGLVGDLIQPVTGIAQSIFGAVQRNKAKKAYEGMENLDYTKSAAYGNAQVSENMAGRFAQEGLPQESLNLYQDQANRTVSSGISSIGSLRSGVSGVAGLASTVLDSNRQIMAMDSNQRLQNREKWFNTRDNLMSQQQKAFDYEMGYDLLERSRYLSEMAGGREQFNQGLNNIAGGLGNLGVDQIGENKK